MRMRRANGARTADRVAAQRPDGRATSVSAPDESTDWEQHAELHPLDFEWYFSPGTARELGESLLRFENVLLLGAPTVALTMMRRQHRNVTLVDRSSTLRARLPELAHRVVTDDVRQFSTVQVYDAVLFDPPWYLPDTLWWLMRATHLVCPGGLIRFVLFPEAVRPSALAERKRILEFAAHLGTVDIDPQAVSYQTPTFEQFAHAAGGESAGPCWRRGDLVTISGVNSRMNTPVADRADPAGQWRTWLIGSQVVKIRTATTAGTADTELAPIDGCPHDVLPTVSLRDHRREHVGLWTSRNRVAKIHDPGAVSVMIDSIAECWNSTKSLDRLRADAHFPHLQRVVQLLDLGEATPRG